MRSLGRRLRGRTGRAVALLLFLAALWIIVHRLPGFGRVLPGTLWLLTPFLLLLHAAVPFPVTPLILADAAVLGPFWALALVWPGLVASAAVAYLLGRGLEPLAGPLFDRLPLPTLRSPNATTLLLLRLLPWIPLSPVSLWAGMVRVPFRRFLWTTALGILPELLLLLWLPEGARLLHLP